MNVQKVSKEFASDLIKLVNSLKGIEKDGEVDYKTKTGQTKKFDYITLDKIYAIVKSNDDFAVMQPLGTDESGKSAVQVILIHKTGECMTSDYYQMRIPENCSKQDEGSAITYTKRYALGAFLGICTDEDNDVNPDGKHEDPKEVGKKPPESKKKEELDYKAMLVTKLKQLDIDINDYAAEHGLTKSSTNAQIKKIYEKLLKETE